MDSGRLHQFIFENLFQIPPAGIVDYNIVQRFNVAYLYAVSHIFMPLPGANFDESMSMAVFQTSTWCPKSALETQRPISPYSHPSEATSYHEQVWL
jgi:hypothetical protein